MGHPGRLTPHSAAVGILLDDVMLHRRRELASGALAPLADSLTADLTWAMSVPPHSPPKARLTRAGGWCPRDGTLLTFHPDRPHEHACRRCLRVFGGDDHYGWWAMGWQLWLAERVLHAAVLNALRPDAHRAAWAAATLGSLARRYLTWPNSDNVLGPSRPFFSTYLESLWLLHLCL